MIAFEGSWLPDLSFEKTASTKGFYTLRIARMVARVSEFSKLQSFRGTDAVVPDVAVLLSLHADWGDDWHCPHRLDSHRGVSSRSSPLAQSGQRLGE